MPFCRSCGAQQDADARFCDECGAKLDFMRHEVVTKSIPSRPTGKFAPSAPVQPTGVYSRKDGATAAVLSLIFPGAGQVYCGRMGRGLAIFFMTLCLIWFLIGIVIWIWGVFDANNSAKQYNAYLDTYDRPPFW